MLQRQISLLHGVHTSVVVWIKSCIKGCTCSLPEGPATSLGCILILGERGNNGGNGRDGARGLEGLNRIDDHDCN